MRQFLHLLKDLRLLNEELKAKDVIEILSKGDPKVCDSEGAINLEIEVSLILLISDMLS